MAQQAYIARLELEYIVVAESRDAARRLAMKAHRNDSISIHDFELGDMTHLPPQYENLDEQVDNDGPGYITAGEAAGLPGGFNHRAKGVAGAGPTDRGEGVPGRPGCD